MALGLSTAGGATDSGGKNTEKPVVSCAQIVEVYEVNHSIAPSSCTWTESACRQ